MPFTAIFDTLRRHCNALTYPPCPKFEKNENVPRVCGTFMSGKNTLILLSLSVLCPEWKRMSEKHLTEPPWKALASKQGIKDIGLQKAIAALAKIDSAKEPARALDTLAEISDLSSKLKKTYAAKADVADYLNEIVKEVKKTIPALEAKVKVAAEAAKTMEKRRQNRTKMKRTRKPRPQSSKKISNSRWSPP